MSDLKPNTMNEYSFLIVEDNEYNRLVLIDTLKEWKDGLKIDIAENGAIGLQKASDNVYDIIFMDLQMPVLNGHECTIAIKKLPKPNCDAPIIAVTANALNIEEKQCKEEGMVAFITKPFEEKVLIKTIEEILKINSSVNPNTDIPVELNNLKGEVVNFTNIVKFTKGNKERMNKMIQLFLDKTPDELNNIKQANDAGDLVKVKNIAHTIKSKYKLMGIPQLAEIALKIESKASNQIETENITELINELACKTEEAIIEFNNIYPIQ